MTAMESIKLRLLLLCAFVAMFPTIMRAHIADFDEVWHERAEEARKAALKAYQPNTQEVLDHFNDHVHKYDHFHAWFNDFKVIEFLIMSLCKSKTIFMNGLSLILHV